MKFAFYTLGCKVNQYETQAMQQMLLADGHTLGEFDEIGDGMDRGHGDLDPAV